MKSYKVIAIFTQEEAEPVITHLSQTAGQTLSPEQEASVVSALEDAMADGDGEFEIE